VQLKEKYRPRVFTTQNTFTNTSHDTTVTPKLIAIPSSNPLTNRTTLTFPQQRQKRRPAVATTTPLEFGQTNAKQTRRMPSSSSNGGDSSSKKSKSKSSSSSSKSKSSSSSKSSSNNSDDFDDNNESSLTNFADGAAACVKQGFLLKKSPTGFLGKHKWQKRYFRLYADVLQYFKEEKATVPVSLVAIPFSPVATTLSSFDDDRRRHYCRRHHH
jgi:hypothetical protein